MRTMSMSVQCIRIFVKIVILEIVVRIKSVVSGVIVKFMRMKGRILLFRAGKIIKR